MLNKKSIDIMNKVKEDLDGVLSELNPDAMDQLDKSLGEFDVIIKEMETKVIEEVHNSEITDEMKAYLTRFIKNPNSKIEDLLDLKIEVRGDKSVSPDTDMT